MGQVKKKAKKTTFDQNELKSNNIPPMNSLKHLPFLLLIHFLSENTNPFEKWKFSLITQAILFSFFTETKRLQMSTFTHSPSCWKEEPGIPETTSDWAPEESWCTATSRSEASPVTSACTSPSNSDPTRFDSDPRMPQYFGAPNWSGVRRSWWCRPLWAVALRRVKGEVGKEGRAKGSFQLCILVCVVSEMFGRAEQSIAGLLSWLATLDGSLSYTTHSFIYDSLLCHFKPFLTLFFFFLLTQTIKKKKSWK